MPTPEPGEEKDKFMARCIPMVMEDGTAADNDQAVAICMSKFEKGPEECEEDVHSFKSLV